MRTFVHETYTQLPDDIRAELEPYVSGARTSLQTNTDALLTQKACAGDCAICFKFRSVLSGYPSRTGGRGFCALVSARERYRLLRPFCDSDGAPSSCSRYSGALCDGVLFQDGGRSMGGRDRGRRARVGGVLSGRLWLAGARPDARRAGGYRAVRAGGKTPEQTQEPEKQRRRLRRPTSPSRRSRSRVPARARFRRRTRCRNIQ